jgi:hypothetical protein
VIIARLFDRSAPGVSTMSFLAIVDRVAGERGSTRGDSLTTVI